MEIVSAIDARCRHQGSQSRSRRRCQARQAKAHDGAVLTGDRHHVSDGADGRQVRHVQGSRGAARLVGQQQLGDLEGDPGSRQPPVGIGAVGPLRVDQRHRRRAFGSQHMVVGDDDVDARLSRGSDLSHTARTGVGGDDEAVTGGPCPLHGRHREPMPLAAAVRDVWLGGDSQPA